MGMGASIRLSAGLDPDGQGMSRQPCCICGTPVEPDFEVVDAWLAALFNLGRMVPGASLRA